MIVSESATVSGFIPLGKHILPLCAITYDAMFNWRFYLSVKYEALTGLPPKDS
jgi:hypothetical protein